MKILSRTFFIFLLIQSIIWTFSLCSVPKSDINKIEIKRVLNYFQKQRYYIQIKGEEPKSDLKIFKIACENFNIDVEAAEKLLKELYPKIGNKIFQKKSRNK